MVETKWKSKPSLPSIFRTLIKMADKMVHKCITTNICHLPAEEFLHPQLVMGTVSPVLHSMYFIIRARKKSHPVVQDKARKMRELLAQRTSWNSIFFLSPDYIPLWPFKCILYRMMWKNDIMYPHPLTIAKYLVFATTLQSVAFRSSLISQEEEEEGTLLSG